MTAPALDVAGRWKRRSAASALLRAGILLVPVAASAATGIVVARALPEPTGSTQVAWWFAVLGASTVVLLAVDRIARRALPLAALLRLTLVFPDRAPSRISVALRSRNLRSLRAWARAASEGDDADEHIGQRATAVLALAAALNAHDRRTRGHSERVRVLSLLVAEELRLPEADTARLGWAALLHDIGKLTVPPAILNKPGAPDGREWEILRRHPADGARIARPLHEWLGGWIDAIEDHHEKYDGSGYPHGLEGKDIPLAARIVSLTDSFETMTAVRSYKKPMTAAAARAELARCAGTHFDPDLVRAFLNISLGRLTWSVGLAAWLAQLPFIGSVPRAGAAIGRVGTPVPAYGGAVAGVGTVAFGVILAVGAPSVDSPAVHDLGGDGPGNSRVVDSEEVQVKSATATRSEPAEHVGGTSEDAVPATGPAPATAKPSVPASPPARSGEPPGNGPGKPPPPGPPA
ncbi:MAG TPA: HD domain-containing phosphohydrolase, partial [Acidimicrobiia bacterium]|nr:HD domain-containing phosphohydrolase [Acidimicrobiia bacterium]